MKYSFYIENGSVTVDMTFPGRYAGDTQNISFTAPREELACFARELMGSLQEVRDLHPTVDAEDSLSHWR